MTIYIKRKGFFNNEKVKNAIGYSIEQGAAFVSTNTGLKYAYPLNNMISMKAVLTKEEIAGEREAVEREVKQ